MSRATGTSPGSTRWAEDRWLVRWLRRLWCFRRNLAYRESDDSKKLSEKRREELFVEIEKHAVAWGIGMADHQVIDEIKYFAGDQTGYAPGDPRSGTEACGVPVKILWIICLFDAVRDRGTGSAAAVHHKRGCRRCWPSQPASIIAKVTRDRMMVRCAEVYPGYAFEKNKGYGTKAHYEGLGLQGICPIHRRTFLKGKSLSTCARTLAGMPAREAVDRTRSQNSTGLFSPCAEDPGVVKWICYTTDGN